MLLKPGNLFAYLSALVMASPARADVTGGFSLSPFRDTDPPPWLPNLDMKGDNKFTREAELHNNICMAVLAAAAAVTATGGYKLYKASKITDAALKKIMRAQGLSFFVPGILLLLTPYTIGFLAPVWIVPATSALGFYFFFQRRAKKLAQTK